MSAGLMWTLWIWVQSLIFGKAAPANPWGGNSLEWHCSSPPPHENFPKTPYAQDPYEYSHWRYDEEVGGYIYEKPQPGKPTQGSEPSHA
jgi:cytochrome c oxidase subunit 1